MTTERVYDIKVNGADSMNELKSAVSELTEKLKSLDQTSKEYLETLKQLTDYQQKLADAMGGISDSAEKTDNSLNGIKETVDSVADSISSLGEDVINSFAEGLAQGMAEAATETAQMGESMDNGVNSVKGLKQEISDLRDKLVTLDKGTDEYKETVQQLINDQVKLKEVMNAGKNETQAAEGSYNALTQRMSALKQVWKETTDEATRNEIGQQINEINNELKALDASIGNSQRNVGNYKSALDGLDTSFVSWKQELKECKEALQQLDPASQEYNDAMMRAAEITHNMAEQQEQIKYSSQDLGDRLETIRGIGSNLAAGFSAVNAAMGLFGEENEEVQQAMLKVQQAMALVQGLQGMEGFLNKTKGLSKSFGLATKATQANTVATRANATAAKADATAKGAEAIATESAVAPQLALNAAMKANPIGFIIGAIATIVTLFVLFKDKIMELIGANEDMSKAFDKVKAVLSGFGNVIKKSIINPIKLAIIPIKTLAKVIMDLFKGNWSAIGDDIKAGMEETKNTVIDTINVVGAFKEGYDKKNAENEEAYRKKAAEARAKDKDEYIKDMEAKFGSTWKYTEQGKKEYDAYFRALAEMYDKDSEDYKQALRDKAAFDREYAENRKEQAKEQEAWELRYNKARYGADFEYSEEWYNKQKKKWEDVQQWKWLYEQTNRMEAYDNAETEWLEYLDSYKKHWESKTKEMVKATEKLLNDFKSAFGKFVPEIDTNKINFDDLLEKWKNGVALFQSELINKYKFTAEQVENITKEMHQKFTAEFYNGMSKALGNSLEKELYQWDRALSSWIKKFNTKNTIKKLTVGIEFPQEEIDNLTKSVGQTVDILEKEIKTAQSDIDEVFTSLLTKPAEMEEILGKELYAISKDQIAQMTTLYADYYQALNDNNTEEIDRLTKELQDSDLAKYVYELFGGKISEFQKLLDKRNNLIADKNNAAIEYFKSIAEISKKVWENTVKDAETAYNNLSANRQALFDKEANNAMKWQGVYENAIRNLHEDKDYIQESYDLQRGYLTNLYNMYIDMYEDETLTFEEREKAKRESIKITQELLQAEWDKENEMLKLEKNLIKEWTNAVKNAFSGVATILGSLNDYYTANMALEQQRIDQLLENNKISQEEAEKRYQQQEENFNKAKNMEAAMTIINGLSAAIGAYQSLASIPYVGPVLGAAAAAAALAASIVNAQKIRETTMDNPYKGTGGSGGGSTNFQLPSVMELEQNYGRNTTGMNDTDSLNNIGSEGKGERAIRTYVVESEITASQELANKRSQEVTF